MQGKTVVATGATSGIGAIAVVELARMGARIVFIARDAKRAEATLAKLEAVAPGRGHSAHIADLSRVAETKRIGGEIAAGEPRVDVLINNAGAIFSDRRVTADGLEMTFALNHMAYFTLTQALRDRLVGSAPARVVSTASAAHAGARLDFDDLQCARGYSAWRAYNRSKLANILFTRELARRLAGTNVTANCSASRRRRLALRRRSRRLDGAALSVRQALRNLADARRRYDRLSRFLAGGRDGQRRIFRQAQDRDALPRRARRLGRRKVVGDERSDHEVTFVPLPKGEGKG